jgi:hypothetical protein
MYLYQNVNPEKNIGKRSGKEFAVFYSVWSRGMYSIYKDGKTARLSDSDDRDILNHLVGLGEVKIITDVEFLT